MIILGGRQASKQMSRWREYYAHYLLITAYCVIIHVCISDYNASPRSRSSLIGDIPSERLLRNRSDKDDKV